MPIITISIDCTKIDKSRLKKGKYLDAILIETPNGKFDNDFMIVESATKEERDAGKRGTILGNGRYPKSAARTNGGEKAKDSVFDLSGKEVDDGIPF